MNTTSIGDQFESKSLEIIRKVIEEGQLGYLGRDLRVYTRKEKGYYSTTRKKNIYFDLTIEVWPPGASRYVLIYIIECKSYNKTVPVNDIEEFHHKIQQVSGVNVKGIFISNEPLQEGAFNIAESIGMMVVQGESSHDYKIILHKTNKRSNQKSIPFIHGSEDESLINSEIKIVEKQIDKKIIEEIFNKEERTNYNIAKLSKSDIETYTELKLNTINPKILTSGYPLSPRTLIKFLKDKEKIVIVQSEDKEGILGWCDIENRIIGIHKSIKNTSRELFILAHEFGHYTLHQKLTIKQVSINNFSDPEYNFKSKKYDLINPRNWIEWQANYFASSLVLPKESFILVILKLQDRLNMTRGKIYLDDQYQNRMNFIKLVDHLAYLFNVSKTTVIYKLNEIGLVNDQSRLKMIGHIISEYKEDFFT